MFPRVEGVASWVDALHAFGRDWAMVQERYLRTIVLLLCAAAALLGEPQLASGQDTEMSERSLRITRAAYEREMEELRSEVQRILTERLDEANAASDARRVEATRLAIAGFESQGTLPEDPRRARWTLKYAQVADDVIRAYGRVIEACEAVGQTDLADRMEDELDLFRTTWDVAPWSQNLGTLESMTLGAETEHDFRTDLPELYRLEVLGRRIGEAGRLIVFAPLPDGGHVRVPCEADVRGEVRVLLTIGEQVATADLGVTEAIEFLDESAEARGVVTLHAEGGAFEVTSVRVKPWSEVDARELPESRPTREPRVRPQRLTGPKSKATPLIDRLEVKSNWRGDLRRVGQPAIAIVLNIVRKTETHVYMHADLPGAGGLEYVFRSTGQSLTLESIRPTGTRGGNYHDAIGTLRLQNDQMHFRYRFKFTQGNKRNQTAEGEMFLRRD